ncbi:hypothetical protein EDD18DRAFT_1420821 [Armillaria luteobubalina]|uniref:Uncharacterized protein n=1 Tax=Armillaria luteobubalina TaxID=153913 RepID=A0AA39TWY6_9AGAR|nr:hypothetical protein EDD18DRAFT_1420821 [Armillaria luteobubalina]
MLPLPCTFGQCMINSDCVDPQLGPTITKPLINRYGGGNLQRFTQQLPNEIPFPFVKFSRTFFPQFLSPIEFSMADFDSQQALQIVNSLAYYALVPDKRVGQSSPSLTTLVMNSMPAGTRVFFWDTRGHIIRGVVQSTSVSAKHVSFVYSPHLTMQVPLKTGTLMDIVGNSDGDRTITLPFLVPSLEDAFELIGLGASATGVAASPN